MIPERSLAGLAPVVVMGRGRLGTALTAALSRTGTDVRLVPGRTRGDSPELSRPAVFVLAVPDREVDSVAAALSVESLAGSVVLHASGALGPEVLESAARAGASVGGFHPLQTFPGGPADAERFAGALVALDGDPAAVEEGRRLATRLGGRPHVLVPGSRALYHLAAVLASNAVVGLIAAARDAAVGAGVPPSTAIEGLAPLARAALEGALTLGPEAALTGPVRRGDEETLERHRAALRAWDPSRLPLYEAVVAEQRRLVDRMDRESGKKDVAGLDRVII